MKPFYILTCKNKETGKQEYYTGVRAGNGAPLCVGNPSEAYRFDDVKEAGEEMEAINYAGYNARQITCIKSSSSFE